MDPELNTTLARTLASLDNLPSELESEAIDSDERMAIISAELFRPEQDEHIAEWFHKFLNVRGSFWEIIDELHERLGMNLDDFLEYEQYRGFVIGFVAACQVVRLDRFLLDEFATDTFIQRKLNEAIPERGIGRKQYTRIFESFIDLDNAQRMLSLMNFAEQQKAQIDRLAPDPDIGNMVSRLTEYAAWLDPSKRNFLRRTASYHKHTLKRRGATIKQYTQFRFLEVSGRFLSNMVRRGGKHVTAEVREQARALLQPGDTLVTRHKYALTNLFMPGFWPHASMYIGDQQERDQSGIDISLNALKRPRGIYCTFEALKDGVLFRTLEQTLAVDGFVILRPNLPDDQIRQGIERIAEHQGKKYNFDFDFFRSDRLVCTELIYRAYDGIGGMDIPLRERAGRPTLSAEDICDLALDTDLFRLVAIFGACEVREIVTEPDHARQLLQDSYR